jgi:hypothetical protein
VSNKLYAVSTNRRQLLQFSGTGIAMAVLGITIPRAVEAAAAPLEFSQKIIVGKKVGNDDWPQYVPANLSLPANRLIQVTVRCYDDGAADIPGGYNIVRGTVDGTMRVIKGTPDSISPTDGTVVKQIPVKETAHTFTVNGDNFFLNVPVPPLSTVVYQFMTPAAGSLPWQCMAACGTGEGGWGGAMATDGWMQGTITVT